MANVRDGLVLGTAAAELGGDGGFGLLELRFQAALVALVELGASSDGVPGVEQAGSDTNVSQTWTVTTSNHAQSASNHAIFGARDLARLSRRHALAQ